MVEKRQKKSRASQKAIGETIFGQKDLPQPNWVRGRGEVCLSVQSIHEQHLLPLLLQEIEKRREKMAMARAVQ